MSTLEDAARALLDALEAPGTLITKSARRDAEDLRAALAEATAPVALESVELQRDTHGMCTVLVNGRVAIRDNGDVISHHATLDWFSSTADKLLSEECDDGDALLRMLGLDPEQCRTEGGRLNLAKIRAALAERDAGEPVAWKFVPYDFWKKGVLTEDPEEAARARDLGIKVDALYLRPAPARELSEEPEVLVRNEREDHFRIWESAGAWLYPGDCIAVLRASGQTERRELSEEASQELAEWFCREMPPGTVVGDPRWWAPRIVKAVLRAAGGEK